MKDIPVRSIKPGQKGSARPEDFKIRDVQTLLGGKDMVQDVHRHDFFFVLFVVKGAGSHEIDFVPYEVHDHSVYFMRPGQVHRLALGAESTGYLMEFKKDFYLGHDKVSADLFRQATNKSHSQLDPGSSDRLVGILRSIFQEYSEKLEGYEQVIKANLSIMFIQLARSRRISDASSLKSRAFAQERLEKLLEFLEEHIWTHKQVAQYADMLNISPYQANAICKETLGKNCSTVINEHIILESKRQLLATSKQISEIAYLLGYEDVSYFIRFFRKQTGYTPEAFRQNSR